MSSTSDNGEVDPSSQRFHGFSDSDLIKQDEERLREIIDRMVVSLGIKLEGSDTKLNRIKRSVVRDALDDLADYTWHVRTVSEQWGVEYGQHHTREALQQSLNDKV